MDELKSLIELVSRNKVKQIEVVGNNFGEGSKWKKLYNGIINDQFTSELEAKDFFFGEGKNSDKYFNRLKRNLRDRLINTLFFIDVNQPNFTDTQKAYYTCYKNSAAVKILLGRGGRRHAVELAERTLRIALSFEFPDIALSLAKDLRTHYSNIVGDGKKAKYYNNIVKVQSSIYISELKAEEYYSNLISNFVSSKATKPELAKLASGYCIELRELISKMNSFRLNFFSYLVFTLKSELENDYSGTLEACEEAILYFGKRNVPTPPMVFWNFWLKILQCHIQLMNYEEAKVASEKCISLPPEGSSNWFGALNYSLILFFHSKNFNRAFEIYQQATANNKYKKLPPSYSEPWRIHEAFIFYFIRIGKIDVSKQKKLKTFRINKFLNEMPTYSKDKYGINITILILHVLFLLLDGRYGEIIDRMESLNTYTHRYLRKDHTFRSNCFIKMLLQLPAASFHKEAVIRKAKKYKDKLESVPLEEANQSIEIEIVPYEMLWEFVLDSLDNKFHHTNKKR